MTNLSSAPVAAVIFDLDGLLIDSDDLTYEAIGNLLKTNFGKEMTRAEFSQFFGHTRDNFVTELSDYYQLSIAHKELLAEVRSSLHYKSTNLKSGALDLLTDLQQRGVKMGLATNGIGSAFHDKIDHLGIRHFFDCILLAEEVSKPKPAPDIYLGITKHLSVLPSESIVLEDSTVGATAAVAAGCNVYFVPNPYIENPEHFVAEHHVQLFPNLVEANRAIVQVLA